MKKSLLNLMLSGLTILGTGALALTTPVTVNAQEAVTAPQLEARNAYAYDVTVTQDAEKATVSYRLSSPASEVKIQMFVEGNMVKEVPGTTLAEYTDTTKTALNNLNTVEIAKADFPEDVEVAIKIAVTSDALTEAKESKKAYSFFHPQGVEIDNNANSPYFGRIYVTECMPSKGDQYLSKDPADGQGVYMFDQQLNPIKNANGTYAFRGGVEFQPNFSTGKTSYDARKVRLTEDGRLFLTGQNEKGNILWELNPDDMNAPFVSVIKGTLNTETWEVIAEDSAFIAAPNVGFDVKGAGENLQLIMLSANKKGVGFSMPGFRCDEYNLGTATEWTTVPSKNIDALSQQYTISPQNTSIEYDNEGGIWYCNSRANPSANEPALVHVNAEGIEDYVVNTEAYWGGGAIRFNPDFTRLAIATGKAQVTIYTVGKDEKGAPTLTKEYDLNTTIGRNCNDIAWDIADNLYVVGNSGEWFKAFSLPRTSGVAVTPAADKYVVKYAIDHEALKLEARNAYAYDVTIEKGETDITVNYRLSSPATDVKIQAVVNGEVAKEFAGTTLAEYTDITETALNNLNKVVIAQAELPQGKEISFKVAVTSETLTEPKLSEKQYRFYHPQGVDIDNNANSPYFGRIYVTETMTPSKEIYHSHNEADRQGIYMFDQQLKPIKNANGTFAFRGGVDFQANFSTESTCYDARKVRIAEDGRVFLTGQNEKGNVLWEVNPDDMNAPFVSVIKGVFNPDTWEIATAEGKFMASQNVGFDVRGAGENLKFIMLSGNKGGFGFSFDGYTCNEYNLGTATTWTTAPTRNIDALTGQYTISPTNTAIEYDNEGGIWYCNSRANPSANEPALVHVNAEGVEDYVVNTVAYYGGGGIRMNPDGTRLAVATGHHTVTIYTVTKDEKGAPVLTEEYTIDTTMGRNTNDIAWDIADNLYLVGNSGEWFKSFSLPRANGVAVTPAADKYNMTIGGDGFPEKLFVIGSVTEPAWNPETGVELTKGENGVYTGEVTFKNANDNFAIVEKLSANWDEVNAGRYGIATDNGVVAFNEAFTIQKSNNAMKVAAGGTFTITVDLKNMTCLLAGTPVVVYPEQLYMIGTINATDQWNPADNSVVLASTEEGKYEAKNVEIFTSKDGGDYGYIAFAATTGTWDEVNPVRYGPAQKDTELAATAVIGLNGDTSYKMLPGTYDFNIDLVAGTVSVVKLSGVEEVIDAFAVVAGNGVIRVVGEAQSVSIFSVNGQNIVTNSAEKEFEVNAGVYVVVVDGKTVKVLVK